MKTKNIFQLAMCIKYINIMKNLLYFALLLSTTLLLISCTTSEQQDAKESEITISGLVTATTNGKDGYTAHIKTKEQGDYTALVSIPNLGKDGGYQRINIGDHTSLRGKVLSSDNRHLIVSQIISVEKAIDRANVDFPMIKDDSFRGISPGDKVSDHQQYIQADKLKTGEGSFDIYQIRGYDKGAVGYFFPDPKDKTLVGNIVINTPFPKTEQDIHVGKSFAELQKALPNLKVHGSEVEGRTYAKNANLSYRLNTPNFTYQVDMEKIPAATKIIEIIVNR